jgi:hypothetical protein
MPNPPTDTPTQSEHHHPLIGRLRWEAWRELMNGNGNAFAVGGAGDGDVVVLAWDFLSRPLGRKEVANLVAWLVMVSGVTAAELEAVWQAQGFALRTLLEGADNGRR